MNAILDEIVAALARGDRVELRGGGTFSVKHRSARAGRNPRTGAHVPVDQISLPFFQPGKEMRYRLNRDNTAPEASGGTKDRPLAFRGGKSLCLLSVQVVICNRGIQIVARHNPTFSGEGLGGKSASIRCSRGNQ